MNSRNYLSKSIINLSVILILLSLVGLGCAGYKNPWRDYSRKPFSSAEWLAGDNIERGRMIVDIFEKRIPDGKTQEQIVKLFGDPDKKTTVENREVWLYRVDLGVAGSDLNMFPISFDRKRGTFAGSVEGGTMSMLVEDE